MSLFAIAINQLQGPFIGMTFDSETIKQPENVENARMHPHLNYLPHSFSVARREGVKPL